MKRQVYSKALQDTPDTVNLESPDASLSLSLEETALKLHTAEFSDELEARALGSRRTASGP